MKDKIKKAVADEFKYRASQGRPIYTMEEVIYIVNEVIDEVFWENGDISQDQLHTLDMQMGVIKGDLKCLTDKVNKLSSLLEEVHIEDKPYTDKSVQSGFGIPVGNNGYTPV